MGKKNFKKKGGKTLQERKKELREAEKHIDKQSTEKGIEKPVYSIDDLLEKAEHFINEFQYELAQKFCQRALEIDADNVRALETSGSLLLELGNTEAAKQCFGRAVEVCPDQGYSKYMYLGQLFAGAQAIQCFQTGIELMLKEKGQQEAQELAAACRDPDCPTDQEISNAYCSIAEIYLTDLCDEAGAEDKCAASVQKAVEADSSNPEAHQLQASLLLSKDRKDEAREAIKKSLSLWLPQLEAAEKGDVPEELFDPIEACPVSFATRMQAGKILIEVEEYESACEVLELLLDEDEDVPNVWYLLGWAHFLQGPDYAVNARHYLSRASQVYKKVKHQDEELLTHITDLLDELGPGEGLEEDEVVASDIEIASSDEEEEAMDQ